MDSQSAAPQAEMEPPKIGRRIVTGVDAQGRSRIDFDQPIRQGAPDDRPHGTDVGIVRQLPSALNGPIEPTPDWKGGNQAPTGGGFARVLTWPAGYSYPRHTTPTLDFIIVVSGQLELVLDTESKTLNPGDVVIQRGTPHAWRVPGRGPCTFAGIGLDAVASR
jgi:quercetin dioxygenase-like cupin family protein